MDHFERLRQLVLSQDWDGIEFARPTVRAADLAGLVRLYWELDGWPARLALVQLIQDRTEPVLAPIMWDVLQAPEDDDRDNVELTKAAALCYLNPEPGAFERFYHDREALRVAVRDTRVSRAASLEAQYRPAAQAGDREAMFGLAGLLHDRGDAEAEQWYERAARAGHRRAMVNLANTSAERGDDDAALHWWTCAAQAGDPRAMYNLAVSLAEQGDSEGAEDWYRRAAEAGNLAAANNLGILLARRGDAPAAAPWLLQAAKAGAPDHVHNYAIVLDMLGRNAEAEHWRTRHGGG